jgi:hypothetical protein
MIPDEERKGEKTQHLVHWTLRNSGAKRKTHTAVHANNDRQHHASWDEIVLCKTRFWHVAYGMRGTFMSYIKSLLALQVASCALP